jgi:hypothetical protein
VSPTNDFGNVTYFISARKFINFLYTHQRKTEKKSFAKIVNVS